MSDAFIVRRGGGVGGGLSFRIVGGTSRPNNPSENTIWINTDEKITKWAFRSDVPSETIDGMVWVQTVPNSVIVFNAAKNNEIILYLMSVSQYNNGVWEAVDGYLFKNGEWIDILNDIAIFDDGKENTALIGSWVTSGSVTNDGTNLVFKGKDLITSTEKKIDLSPFSRLVFVAKNKAGASAYVGIGTKNTAFTAKNTIAAYTENFAEYSIDTSEITEECYLLIQTASASNAVTVQSIILYV